MLKYLNTQVTFAEIPDEITLCINITGCRIGCKGCHSSYLAEDIGEALNTIELFTLIDAANGITCVCFMGGDSDPEWVNRLALETKFYRPDLKIAWYSGRQELSNKINLDNFDYIKLGPYDQNIGGLSSPTTNQVFYKIDHPKNELINITSRFWNENKD